MNGNLFTAAYDASVFMGHVSTRIPSGCGARVKRGSLPKILTFKTRLSAEPFL